MNYKPIIGLEIHVELKTKSKMFCSCSADYFGHKPNTHCCPVCLGLPGALPVPNEQAIKWCLAIGLSLNCKIPNLSKFDRKNYFYPDLPKGYQISQYDQPFCVNGYVILNKAQDHSKNVRDSSPTQNDIMKTIRIRRVHMEEDTAKLIHQFGTQNSKLKTQNDEKISLIDFNRSGIPLVEIVTEPDIEAPEEARLFLQKLQQIVRYLDVSNADMEKGDMRLEPNISVREIRNPKSEIRNEELPNYKVEVKNINSFRFVEKAIEYEIKRQKEILENGETPIQETRGWDDKKQRTVSQRIKEEASDYRYFPEPDIPPIRFTQNQISNIKYQISELPDEKNKRFIKEYHLSDYDAEILTREKSLADYFEEAVKIGEKQNLTPKQIANHIINRKVETEKILTEELIRIILSATQTTSVSNDELDKIIDEVLKENQKAIDDYKKGNENVMMFLMGQVIKKIGKKIETEALKRNIISKIK